MKRNVRRLALFLTAVLLAGSCTACTEKQTAEVDPIADNYRVGYQIFVGSFSDSDGDGIGDLQGIIDRIDYLNDGDVNGGTDLGVQLLWLSPIFPSPSYHKYDTTDYYAVDPKFGTEETLKELLRVSHERNVKVILDIALNHTSSANVMFQKFVTAHNNGDTANEFYDWYSWANYDNRRNGCTYAKLGTTGNEYYECNFDTGMPELNYDNPDVRAWVLETLKYWLDLGVDGFRFDAVKYIYFGEQARNVSYWKELLAELRETYPEAYFVGECWSGNSEIAQYCEALNCFDFSMATAEGFLAKAANGKSGQIDSLTKYVSSFNARIGSMREDALFQPFIANHDMDRAAGYLTISSGAAYMAANLLLLGPGSPVIYYGEEIGMKGTRGASNTDANRRLAMLWGDGDTVRDPQGSTFDASKQVNGTVATQKEDETSLLRHYGRVIALRNRYPAIARGSYQPIDFESAFLGGYDVTYEGAHLAILHNTANTEVTVDLAEYAGFAFTKLVETVGLGSAALDGTKLTVGADTSCILQ